MHPNTRETGPKDTHWLTYQEDKISPYESVRQQHIPLLNSCILNLTCGMALLPQSQQSLLVATW